THERYAELFQKDFGGVIPAIFTDEPQFAHKGNLAFAREELDVALPWTDDFAITFQQAYGSNILGALPELLWELPDGASLARYQYHDHIAARFAEAFADQCGEWCEKHGIAFTGHMMEEPTLWSQTRALGDAMRSYRAFQLPGIDMLCDWREFTTAKQAQSAVHQYGREGMLSELYGVTNYDFDFRNQKLSGDWQAALGVTIRVPHLSWVSMQGEAKRDYPATFNYQAPWYKEYPYLEDYFSRLNTVLTRGKPVARVGVIHPVESYWLYWGPEEQTAQKRAQLDDQFQSLTNWLLTGFIDFEFICESNLPDQCSLDLISETFPVGEMAYDVILVPPLETIRKTTFERLELFAKRGGKVLFLGTAPKCLDGSQSPVVEQWRQDSCETISFGKDDLLNALEEYRLIDVKLSSGGICDEFLYQLRDDGESLWFFAAHANRRDNKDVPFGQECRFTFAGLFGVLEYDALTGEARPIACEHSGNKTVVKKTLYEHDSLLLRLEKGAPATSIENESAPETSDPILFLDKAPVTLDEPNVLLLDIFEGVLDGESLGKDEILRINGKARAKANYQASKGHGAQPWIDKEDIRDHEIKLIYEINSEIDVEGAKLAAECLENAKLTLNGADVPVSIDGWYVDKSIETTSLPTIRKGKTVLELSFPYGRKVDLEAMFLLGDFGVKLEGIHGALTEPVRALAFGDITRQGLPFYGGNITYHLQADFESSVLTVSSFRGHLLSVAVDGAAAGKIALAPYKLTLASEAGHHEIDITLFGNRINTFGQIHNSDPSLTWWGPQSWHTRDEGWSYEYKPRETGILKSPELASIIR
ncbi:MAG: hypothetical protein LBC41_09160, partial [Clostridiales bacterium]|nr:hypothetical protein [Clostridiales bacterium]